MLWLRSRYKRPVKEVKVDAMEVMLWCSIKSSPRSSHMWLLLKSKCVSAVRVASTGEKMALPFLMSLLDRSRCCKEMRPGSILIK